MNLRLHLNFLSDLTRNLLYLLRLPNIIIWRSLQSTPLFFIINPLYSIWVLPNTPHLFFHSPLGWSVYLHSNTYYLAKSHTFTMLPWSLLDILTGKKWIFGIFSLTDDMSLNLKTIKTEDEISSSMYVQTGVHMRWWLSTHNMCICMRVWERENLPSTAFAICKRVLWTDALYTPRSGGPKKVSTKAFFTFKYCSLK